MIIKELTLDNSLNSSKIAPNFYEEVVNCFQEFKTLWHRLQTIPFQPSSGLEMFLVDLTQEKTGAFKIRGATTSIGEFLKNRQPHTDSLVVASSGNFGIAVAVMAAKFALNATIFMPVSSPIQKQDYIKSTGAKVVITNDGEARQKALEFTRTNSHCFFVDGAQWPAFRGNGTFLLELLQLGLLTDQKTALVLPLGSGSLAVPTGLILHQVRPNAELIAIEPLTHCKFLAKYAQNVQPTWGTTLAEGVALHQLPKLSDRLLPEIVDVIFGVTESEIITAICYLWENCQLKAEASAVLPIAAYLANPSFFSQYQQVYFFITGGNIEDDLFDKILRGNVTQ